MVDGPSTPALTRRASRSNQSPGSALKAVHFKLDPPEKTGNDEMDELATTRFTCLVSVVEDLMSTKELVMPIFNFLKDKKQTVDARKSVGPSTEMFSEQTTLSSLDENFKIALITQWSDVGADDVVKVLKADSGAVNDLILYATQLPMRVKMPMEFLVRALMPKFLTARREACGSRLTSFKAAGGIDGSGNLVFKDKCGAYCLTFDGHKRLTEVTHNATGVTKAVNTKTGLSKDYVLMDNNDDHAARLVMEPMPAFKLVTLFDSKAKEGPWKVRTYHGKPKDLAKVAKDMHTEWQTKREEEKLKETLSSEVQDKMNAHRAEKRKENMNNVRVAASKALAKKKARKSIAL